MIKPKRPTIYFLSNGDGAIKVGYSTCFARRLPSIQTASSRPLEVIGTIDGTRAHEKAIHRRLSEHRVQGEWFADCVPVRDFIDDLIVNGVASLNVPAPAPSSPTESQFLCGFDLGPPGSCNFSISQILEDIGTNRLERAFASYEEAKREHEEAKRERDEIQIKIASFPKWKVDAIAAAKERIMRGK